MRRAFNFYFCRLIVYMPMYLDSKRLVLLIGLLIIYSYSRSQIDLGGLPRSFQYRAYLKNDSIVHLTPPDLSLLKIEDDQDAALEKPYRVGVPVSCTLNPFNSGVWEDLPDGGKLWHLHFECGGAVALGIDYSDFFLPCSSDLFVYN